MPNDPIPLDLARRRARTPPPGEPSAEDDDHGDRCPILALGHFEGTFVFLDIHGHVRRLTARQLGTASDLSGLFTGATDWLVKTFPRQRKKVTKIAGETIEEFLVEPNTFNAAGARDHLMRLCGTAGLFGDHVIIRRSGIWRDAAGAPVVHCGDVILFSDGTEQRAGQKIGDQIWAAYPPTPRPDDACGSAVARALQQDIQRLWRFRHGGGAIMLLGLVGTGYLGIAARWRPNAFLAGEPGTGKSHLLNTAAALAPLHYHTNNSTEAGVLGAVNGHTMPIFIDESSDRKNAEGAEALMDLVLASSSGDGTKGTRGKADGGFRTIEMAGVVIYGSITPPPLQPQHRSRIALIELLVPGPGEYHGDQMEALIESCRAIGPGLWGRALESWQRWRSAFESFRSRLGEVGCAAREMDQMGAILAGWWILTEDGVPDSRRAAEGVAAVAEFIRKADEVAEESAPRSVIDHLLSARVQYDGTSRQDTVGALLARAFANDELDPVPLARALAGHGIRPVPPCLKAWNWIALWRTAPSEKPAPMGWVRDDRVSPVLRACDCLNCYGKRGPVPRVSDSGGIWLAPVAVNTLFRGIRGLEGGRWEMELLRVPGVTRTKKKSVRVGDNVVKAIWIPREDIDREETFTPEDIDP